MKYEVQENGGGHYDIYKPHCYFIVFTSFLCQYAACDVKLMSVTMGEKYFVTKRPTNANDDDCQSSLMFVRSMLRRCYLVTVV